MNRADLSLPHSRPAILPGFTDPVHDAQNCFRTVLEAMSRPGETVPLTALPAVTYLNATMAGACLSGMVSIALTLCDANTPVWLDGRLDTPAMRQHLRFHCGCPVVSDPGRAAFAFIGDAKTMLRFERFSSGTLEYPDRSATLIIAAGFTATAPVRLISGPGVSALRYPQGLPFSPTGLPAWFWDALATNRAGYPLGVDIVFVDSSRPDGDTVRIAALPRTALAIAPDLTGSGPTKENRVCMSR